MQTRQATHNLKMTKLLGPDVHEKIFAIRILAVEALNRILHRGR